jgi:hypothetical protein
MSRGVQKRCKDKIEGARIQMEGARTPAQSATDHKPDPPTVQLLDIQLTVLESTVERGTALRLEFVSVLSKIVYL